MNNFFRYDPGCNQFYVTTLVDFSQKPKSRRKIRRPTNTPTACMRYLRNHLRFSLGAVNGNAVANRKLF